LTLWALALRRTYRPSSPKPNEKAAPTKGGFLIHETQRGRNPHQQESNTMTANSPNFKEVNYLRAVLPGGETASVVAGWRCPCGCGRTVRATDIEVLDDGWRIVCPESGRDILTVTLP
jgi:hypothetical protein